MPVLRCLGAAVLFAASAPAASKLAGQLPALTLAGLLYLGAGIGVAPGVLRSWGSGRAAVIGVGRRGGRAAVSGGGRRVGRQGGRRGGWGVGGLGGMRLPALGQKESLHLAVAVLAGGAVGPVLLVAGLSRTSAASASLLLNTELAATVLFAVLLFREHMGAVLLAAVMLITGSGAVLAWSPGAAVDPGALLVIGACLCWGLDNVVTARIEQLTPGEVVLVKGLVAGGANVALGLAVHGGDGLPTAGAALAAVAIGTVGYGWSIILWVRGARQLGAARAQVCFSTAPFIGAALAWTTLGEPLTGAQSAAVAVAGCGVVLSLLSAHGHPHLHPAMLHTHEHHHPDVHHDDTAHDDAAEDAVRGDAVRGDAGAGNAYDTAGDDGGFDGGVIGGQEVVARRHTHGHRHPEQRHDGTHVPDVHHRHQHNPPEDSDPPLTR